MTLASRSYAALVHHPVLEKSGRVVTTAVTNLDVHDIARASRTYGLAGYFVVTPIAAQRKLVEEILGHWVTGAGREHNDQRTAALELVRIVSSLEEAVQAVTAERGGLPFVVATGARARPNVVGFSALRTSREADPRAVLLVFGTGWGLAPSVFEACDAILAPIQGSAAAEYNHLSVRSAVAIVLDRLFARYE
jgi:hypothetical protein